MRPEAGVGEKAGEGRGVGIVGENASIDRSHGWRWLTGPIPRPCVPEPELRNEMQRRAIGAAIVSRDPEQQRVFALLGDLDDDVEIALIVEDPGVNQLELRFARSSAPVFFDELRVGERALRILVEHPLIGMAGDRVEVEVLLLDILAVVAFAGNESEIALLENRIAFIPEGHRPAEDLIAVTEPGDAILAPAIGLRSRQVVGEERPRIAILAVVLAHRGPRAVGEVGTPLVPAGALVGVAGEAHFLDVHFVDRTTNVKC